MDRWSSRYWPPRQPYAHNNQITRYRPRVPMMHRYRLRACPQLSLQYIYIYIQVMSLAVNVMATNTFFNGSTFIEHLYLHFRWGDEIIQNGWWKPKRFWGTLSFNRLNILLNCFWCGILGGCLWYSHLNIFIVRVCSKHIYSAKLHCFIIYLNSNLLTRNTTPPRCAHWHSRGLL